MVTTYDTIVVGLGAMGSATLYQLAKRGNKVLGIDQFAPPHMVGSSHGDTRITRQAIGEGEQYVPLVLRSNELWSEIEDEMKIQLFCMTGALIISSPEQIAVNHVSNFFQNTVRIAKKWNIPHEMLNSSQIRERFPQFNVRENEVAYYEYHAGYLRPEKCVESQLALAKKYGAEMHTFERVINLTQSGDSVKVMTDKGIYEAGQLIISVGSWVYDLIARMYSRHFDVVRQILFWFDVEKNHQQFLPANFPVFIWELQGDTQGIYGFPMLNGRAGGIKVATEQFGRSTNMHRPDTGVMPLEIQLMYRRFIKPYLLDVSSRCIRAVTCPYTSTVDSHFVIDRHPECKSVMIVSPCSGHGFKHSAAIGESVAQIVMEGKSRIDLSSFGIERLMRWVW